MPTFLVVHDESELVNTATALNNNRHHTQERKNCLRLQKFIQLFCGCNCQIQWFVRFKMTHSRILRVVLIALSFSSLATAQSYHWRRALTLPANTVWQAVAFNPLSHGRVIFAGSKGSDGVYRSDDGGQSWIQGLSPADDPIADCRQVICIPSDTNIVMAVTPRLLYRSTDGGHTWHYDSNNLSLGGADGEVIGFHAATDAIYYGQTSLGYLWKSLDHGATWIQTGAASTDSITLCDVGVSQETPPIVLQASELRNGAPTGHIARSSDEGASWLVTLDADTGYKMVEVPKIVFSDYAINPQNGKHEVAVISRWRSYYRAVMLTTDAGLTWTEKSFPERHVWALDVDQRRSLISKPSDPSYPSPLHYFIGLFDVQSDTMKNGMVQETTDGGNTWRSVNFPAGSSSDPNNPLSRRIWVLKYDTSSSRIAVAADSGVYIGDLQSSVGTPTAIASGLRVSHGSGYLDISSDEDIRSVRLYDILGREITSVTPHTTEYQLPLSTFITGTYALEIVQNGSQPFLKLLSLP